MMARVEGEAVNIKIYDLQTERRHSTKTRKLVVQKKHAGNGGDTKSGVATALARTTKVAP